MTDYLIFAAIIIAFAAVRVMRGGLGPQPPRWLMAAMPPVCVFLLTQNVYVAAAGAYGRVRMLPTLPAADYDNYDTRCSHPVFLRCR